jgi:hypothetical protein
MLAMPALRSEPMPADKARRSAQARARAYRAALGAALVALVFSAALASPPHRVFAASTSGLSAATVNSADTSGSAETSDTTKTVETTKSVSPTPTATFARIAGSSLCVFYPAPANKLIAVGFHQASNRKAFRFYPRGTCYKIAKASKTKALLKKNTSVKLFQQPLRGRGSSNFSAADCAVPPKTVVLAPVTGVVTSVKTYKLYGYITDLRLEIKPDGWKHLRVVMIHITKVTVKKGNRVVGGVTPVATVRHLPFVSTINRFVPVSKVEHVHIQVNRDTFKGSF